VAQGERRRLEDLLVEAPIVLDGRRLVHRLDDGERELGRAGNHEDGTRVALGPVDRQGHDRLLCSGVRGAGASRGWREKGTGRLRYSNPILCDDVRGAGASRGWREKGTGRLRYSNPIICDDVRGAGASRGWREKGTGRLRYPNPTTCRCGRGAGSRRGCAGWGRGAARYR